MMMEPAGSGEDEDRANLINGGVNHRTRTSFQINDVTPPNSRASRFEKRFLFTIIVVLLLVLILVLLLVVVVVLFNSRGPRIECSRNTAPSSLDRVRESELQALNLLKRQELEIFRIWSDANATLLNRSNFSSLSDVKSSNSSLVNYNSALEALRSRLFGQISLSRRVQTVLLSSHEVRDENVVDLSENYTDASVLGLDRCGKVDRRLSGRRTVEWNPRSGKYLFAICVSGQMSNHLICLEKHMFFAALLGRVLVIPSAKVDYVYQRVLDIEQINRCLGRKVVVTFEEFAESEKDHLRINKFMCYFSLPQPCYVDDDHVKKLKEELGMSLSKVEAVWEEDVKEPKQRSVKDVLAKFTSDAEVVAIGDVFFADLEKEWVMQPGGPIAHNCKTLIEPSRLILLTAQRFVQTFLGKDFVALHFRRHGFLKFCNTKQASCFYPVPQAAECINRVVERVNSPVIYLSTDAAESETGLLQSLVVWNGKTVPLVQRPARDAAEKWDALLYRHGLDGDAQVDAMLDKTICALSTVFIGSSGSTFTEDILRLRKDWGSASVCDEYLCQVELPNFIAEDE